MAKSVSWQQLHCQIVLCSSTVSLKAVLEEEQKQEEFYKLQNLLISAMLIQDLKSVKPNSSRPPHALHPFTSERSIIIRNNAILLGHAGPGAADVPGPTSPPTTPMLVVLSPSSPSWHIYAPRCDSFDSPSSTVDQKMQAVLNRVLSLAYKHDILVKTSFTASYASRNVVFLARQRRRPRCRTTCAKFVLKRAAWIVLC